MSPNAAPIRLTAFLILATGCVELPRMAVLPTASGCRTVQLSSPADDATHVMWIGPIDSRDRARLDVWCDSVGPVIIDSTARASAPAADMVAVVVWNTHVGSGDVAQLVTGLRRGDFTDGRVVEHFVLLMQEVYRDGPEVPGTTAPGFRAPRSLGSSESGRALVLETAHTLGLNVMYAPSMRNGPGQQDRGNAIVSTLPFDDPVAIELPFERQRRVSIAVRVHGHTAGGKPWRLAVASAHFDTSLAVTRGGPAQARARQARALIGALSVFDGPLVVAGDFNTWWGDDEPAVKDLRRAFPDAQPTPSRQATWSGPLGAAGRVDYLFARLGGMPVAVRRLSNRFGSDHHPLVATLDIKN